MKKIIYLTTLILLATTAIAQDYWEIINTPPGLNLSSIDVNPNGIIYIGLRYTSGGGVFKSEDGGLIWINTGLSNLGILSITITKNDVIYAGSDYVYLSTNEGDSWEIISQLLDPITLFVSDNKNLFTGIWGGIYKSESIGSNWVQVLSLENTEVVNAIIEDTTIGVLYAGTINFIGGGGVYRSVDGGDTWKHIGLTDNYVSSLALNSSGDLFAGTRGHQYLGGGGVFVLPAGQTEWINLNDDELVTSIVINSEDEIYIGCSTLDFYWGGVRCSLDNGQTWEDISYESMYDEDIEELILGPEENLYALAYNSATPLYKSINSTVNLIQDYKIDKSIITYNFPNPFSDKTTIKFKLTEDYKNTRLKIFDISGKPIREFNITGKKSQQWDGRDKNGNLVKNGIYFYNINYNNISSKLNKILFIN